MYYYYIRGIDVHLGRYDINITVSIKDLRQSSRFITISIDSILAGEGKLRRYGEAYIDIIASYIHASQQRDRIISRGFLFLYVDNIILGSIIGP